jgi:hypothetical protein
MERQSNPGHRRRTICDNISMTEKTFQQKRWQQNKNFKIVSGLEERVEDCPWANPTVAQILMHSDTFFDLF